MFEASSVYFQYVNERAAHVKLTVFPFGVDLGCSKSFISHVVGWFFDYWSFMNENLSSGNGLNVVKVSFFGIVKT